MPKRALAFLVLVEFCACASQTNFTQSASAASRMEAKSSLTIPKHGLSPEEQTQHVLNRLAFGASPSDVELVKRVGVREYIVDQLQKKPDAAIEESLRAFPTLQLSLAQAYEQFPPMKERMKEAGLEKKGMEPADFRAAEKQMRKEFKDEQPRQILVEATTAKIIRSVASKRQLEEVLVDFWFNHFNVSAEKNQVKWSVTSFERDAIRPFVFGRFEDMLVATTKHPAMLVYLDNVQSVREGMMEPKANANPRGLNENYARELMELHTLGVNAGYSQQDVTAAAKTLTGWSMVGKKDDDEFGEFQFRTRAHDTSQKNIFGLTLDGTGGITEGEKLLHYLASHQATAKHLSKKLCQRFVSDSPSEKLVQSVAQVYLDSNGDLTHVYNAIFSSDDFWAAQNVGSKTKTPFEFVVSAIRAVGTLSEVKKPLVNALASLGNQPYVCNPPTGYSEIALPWINAGALVSRINFGLQMVKGNLAGVRVRPMEFGANKNPTVDDIALIIFGKPVSENTRKIILNQQRTSEVDETKPIDVAMVAGLLVGSPEFQKQ
jgi:uncharacterized protein (DUF1800 family)